MVEYDRMLSILFSLSGGAGVTVCARQHPQSLRAVGQRAVPGSVRGELPGGCGQPPTTPAPPRRVGEREGCRPPHQSQQKDSKSHSNPGMGRVAKHTCL